MLKPLIMMVTNGNIPFRAKLGNIQSIDSILTENMVSASSLAKEKFVTELGKIMEKMINDNIESKPDIKRIQNILEKISEISPGAKNFVQKCCSNTLKKFSIDM